MFKMAPPVILITFAIMSIVIKLYGLIYNLSPIWGFGLLGISFSWTGWEESYKEKGRLCNLWVTLDFKIALRPFISSLRQYTQLWLLEEHQRIHSLRILLKVTIFLFVLLHNHPLLTPQVGSTILILMTSIHFHRKIITSRVLLFHNWIQNMYYFF